MNKVLIEICVPVIGDRFDVFVPVDVPIGELNKVVANGVAEITSGRYVASKNEHLCQKEPVSILDPSLTLQDYDIQDGKQLYLI